jgi:serine protease
MRLVAIVAALGATIASAAAAEGLATPASLTRPAGIAAAPIPGRLIVRWRNQAPVDNRRRPAASEVPATAPVSPASGAWRHRRALGNGAHLLEATDASTAATERLLASLRADPDVEYAEPDYVRRRSAAVVTPDDPLFAQQWALPMVHAQEAWARSTGSQAVTVAIIDTGIVMHAELAARVVGGYDFISDPAAGGDGDGRDADYSDPGTSDEESSGLHGTHVAGIVAAQANNDVGVAGLDWSCRLLVARVLGVDHGQGADSDIADAIRWSAGLHVDGVPDNAQPAQVINLSFGGAGFSQTLQDAVHAAISNGAIVVAAAGNDGGEARYVAPASLDGVIAVGAVDPTGQRASYSNFGHVVALMAPGGSPDPDPTTGSPQGILSTMRIAGMGDTYAELAGTSQASPFVAATVSLMKAAYPRMTAIDARDILEATANPSAQCADPNDATVTGCGSGLLDVDAAVALAVQSQAQGGFDSHLGNVVHGGCAVAGRGTGANDGGPPLWLGLVVVALAGVRQRRRML